MEISYISPNCIKIKGKHSSLIIDPSSDLRSKVGADAIVLLCNFNDFNPNKIEDYRVLIKGEGEYEIAGIKISAARVDNNLIYNCQIDGINLLLAKTSTLEGIVDKLKEYEITVLNAESEINESLITSLEPKVALFYGEKAKEALKILGKEIKPVSKYVTTREKLPEETEVVLLSG